MDIEEKPGKRDGNSGPGLKYWQKDEKPTVWAGRVQSWTVPVGGLRVHPGESVNRATGDQLRTPRTACKSIERKLVPGTHRGTPR